MSRRRRRKGKKHVQLAQDAHQPESELVHTYTSICNGNEPDMTECIAIHSVLRQCDLVRAYPPMQQIIRVITEFARGCMTPCQQCGKEQNLTYDAISRMASESDFIGRPLQMMRADGILSRQSGAWTIRRPGHPQKGCVLTLDPRFGGYYRDRVEMQTADGEWLFAESVFVCAPSAQSFWMAAGWWLTSEVACAICMGPMLGPCLRDGRDRRYKLHVACHVTGDVYSRQMGVVHEEYKSPQESHRHRRPYGYEKWDPKCKAVQPFLSELD